MKEYTNEEINNRLHIDIQALEREAISITYKMEELLKTARRLRKERNEMRDSIARKKALLSGEYKSL